MATTTDINKSVRPHSEMLEKRITAEDATGADNIEFGRLPEGAVVTMVDVETTEAFDATTTIDVGTASAGNLFVDGGSIAATGNLASTKVTKTAKREVLTCTFNQASAAGVAAIRVIYTLPTEVTRDY